jgi:hypothetical protein
VAHHRRLASDPVASCAHRPASGHVARDARLRAARHLRPPEGRCHAPHCGRLTGPGRPSGIPPGRFRHSLHQRRSAQRAPQLYSGHRTRTGAHRDRGPPRSRARRTIDIRTGARWRAQCAVTRGQRHDPTPAARPTVVPWLRTVVGQRLVVEAPLGPAGTGPWSLATEDSPVQDFDRRHVGVPRRAALVSTGQSTGLRTRDACGQRR